MSDLSTASWLDILQTQSLPSYLSLLEKHTGRSGVLARLEAAQTAQWQQALVALQVSAQPSVAELRTACTNNLAVLNQIVCETIGTFDWENVLAQLRQHIPSHVLHGQFLSRDCLEKMVRHCPPRTTITAAGYSSIDAYLHKESVYELLAAARFTESSDWMQRYLQNYRSLTPRDFTYQPVQFLLLEPQRWWK